VAEAPRDRKTKVFSTFFRPTRRFGILGAQLGDAFEGAIFKAHEGKQFALLENPLSSSLFRFGYYSESIVRLAQKRPKSAST
jgi:hypothetical protein